MRRIEILTTALVVAIIVFAALDSTVFFFRADITQNKIYTFSPATKQLFRRLPQNVRITYWVSNRLKKISPIPGQIESILKEYAAVSRGKVSVRFENPDSQGKKSSLKSLGIAPEQMNILNQNARTTATVYSGIVLQYLNRQTAIPFIASTHGIEYSLTSKIDQLLNPSKWNVDVLIGNSKRSLSGDYTLVADGLGRFYHVRQVKPGASIPSSTQVLIVLGGADLKPADLAPINHYLMQGGRILFAVPGVNIEMKKGIKAASYGKLPIFQLLDNYGVKVEQELVLDTSNKDFRTLRQSGGQYVWQDYGPYPYWVSLLPGDVSKASPVTRNFSALDLLWPSPLTKRNLPGVTYHVLLKSSPNAWTVSKHFDVSPLNLPAFSKPSSSDVTGQFDLGVSMSGRFPDYFTSATSPKTRMIVVGNDDFLSNLVHYSNSVYNINFLEDAVDWLAGNDGLLSIKTKAQWNPQLDKIQNQQAKLRVFHFAQFVNVFLIPIIIVLFGWRRYAVRKRRSAARRERG